MVSVSVVAEVAWVLDLLVQTAAYAEPALDELDRSLLPGIASHRAPLQRRFVNMWKDAIPGCPELIVAAARAGCLTDDHPRALLAWLSTLPSERPARYPSRRLARLDTDIRLRRMYRDILSELWELAGPAWHRRGRAVAAAAVEEWRPRLAQAPTPLATLKLMPPRHPLTRMSTQGATALIRRLRAITLVPIYFCMSGGLVADVGDRLFIGVPASALEPIRRTRDAAFVASRMRILGEPTRVRILIYLMSAPSGVMDVTRALQISQPTVSGHIRVLARAGLLRTLRRRGRVVYTASPRGLERLIEDATATLSRWA